VNSVGRAIIDYGGEEVGKASLLKIIGNTFIINMIESLAEGHVLAEKTGLGAANLEKFLEVVFPGPFMIHSKRMSTGAYYKTEVRNSNDEMLLLPSTDFLHEANSQRCYGQACRGPRLGYGKGVRDAASSL
jgi:3-hydroxyisobutyrate dehydrogenase-like beta-hydroxyacid dehydrogenase